MEPARKSGMIKINKKIKKFKGGKSDGF